MRGSEYVAHVVVVTGVLVGVTHYETDGTTCRHAFEDATQQFYLVFFLTCCRDLALSGTATVQLGLNEIHVNRYTCWHTVDDTSNGLTVTLTESR